MLTTLSAATFEIVKLGWDAWVFPSSPNVLGATVKDSLLDLLDRVFHGHEVSVAKWVFGVLDPSATTLAAVFNVALSTNRIGAGYDGSALLNKLVTVGPGLMSAEKRAAIAAYRRKWCLAGAWDWSSDARDTLISAAGDRAVEAALRHGTAKLCSVRVLLMGGSTRGKTSTVSSLLGHAFVPNRESTVGIDLETHYLVPGSRGLSPSEIKDRAIKMESYASAVSRIDQEQVLMAMGTPAASSASSASAAPLDPSDAAKPMSKESSIGSAPRSRASDEHGELRNTTREAMRAPVDIEGENGHLLRIWDFGGQKEYEMCHQLFISQRSVLMFAVDLQKLWCKDSREEEFDELLLWLKCAFTLTEGPGVRHATGVQHVVVVGTRKSKCDNVEGAWEALEDLISTWSGTVYDAWVRKPASGGESRMRLIALENDGAIDDAEGSGLLELEKHLWSITEQIIESSQPVPVRWRALLEELVRAGDNKLFLTKKDIIGIADGFPGFEQTSDGLELTVMTMLRYFRDLGELVLFEMSSETEGNPSGEDDICIVFVNPDKLLSVLRAIIGPYRDIMRCLKAYQKKELQDRGLVDMDALDVLWENCVPKRWRLTMVKMLCSFDLLLRLVWHEQEARMVGIPALMPCLGSCEDFVKGMGLGRGERDLEVFTVFTEFFPVGLIGVLIANLHNTVGRQRTDVQYIRADAVLLSLSERERVLMKYVQSGHDSMKAHIKWLFRGKRPARIAYQCLLQFCRLMQSQFRQVTPRSYRHVIISDCARGLSCCRPEKGERSGDGCGDEGSVELEIDREKLQSGHKRGRLHLREAACSRPECGVYHKHAPLKGTMAGYPTPALPSQPAMTEPSRKRKRHEGLNSCHGAQKRRELGSSAASAGEKADDPASAVRKSVADDDSRRAAPVREAASMPHVSDIDLEHIKQGRYDLFISFHGGEELAQGITTRFIVGEAVEKIREAVRNRGVAPGPSIFFDETEVTGPLTDIFKAVMQTCGGGAAVFLLTKAYFSRKYCLAELRAFMDMHKRAVAGGHIGVKLRFICLGPSVDDILNDPYIKKLVPGLPESCIHAVGEKDVVRAIADAFLGAWEGNNTTPGINLGRDVQESFGHLAVALESVDIDNAMRVLDVRGSSMWQVLDAALAGPYISHYNVEKLHDVITGSRPRPPQSVRNELIAYQRKWCDAEHWKWGRDVLKGMCGMVEEAEKDIAEQFPR